MEKIKVIVPNLDRRPDRWRFCHESLHTRDVPDACITRFSSHDHRDYDSSDAVERAITEQFNGPPPRYLRKEKWERSKSHYCWCWTWFDIIYEISQHQNGFYLVLVDDAELVMDYDELCHNVQLLTKAGNSPIRLIQLWQRAPTGRPAIKSVPAFQHGFNSKGDPGIIYSPLGAQFMIEHANAINGSRDTGQLMEHVRDGSNHDGFFTICDEFPYPHGAIRHHNTGIGKHSDREECPWTISKNKR